MLRMVVTPLLSRRCFAWIDFIRKEPVGGDIADRHRHDEEGAQKLGRARHRNIKPATACSDKQAQENPHSCLRHTIPPNDLRTAQ